MNRCEWQNLWAYITGCFPSWKPNTASETSWLKELSDFDSADVTNAVREISKNEKNSFFPPSVFKIVSELKSKRTAVKFSIGDCTLCKGHRGIVSVKRRADGQRWPETASMRCSCAIGATTKSTFDGDNRTWSQWGIGATQRGWELA